MSTDRPTSPPLDPSYALTDPTNEGTKLPAQDVFAAVDQLFEVVRSLQRREADTIAQGDLSTASLTLQFVQMRAKEGLGIEPNVMLRVIGQSCAQFVVGYPEAERPKAFHFLGANIQHYILNPVRWVDV